MNDHGITQVILFAVGCDREENKKNRVHHQVQVYLNVSHQRYPAWEEEILGISHPQLCKLGVDLYEESPIITISIESADTI